MEDKQFAEKIERCDLVYKTVLTQEAMAETVVPDAMPDIVRLLDTEAAVFLRSKTVETGRVILEGNILGTVLYAGEDTVQPQKLELSIPFSCAQEEPSLTDTDQLVVDIHLSTAEPRIMNPRKLMLRAEVAGEVSVFRKSTLCLATETEDLSLFETLYEERNVGYIASVQEKNFIVSEELALPPAHPTASQLLLPSVRLILSDSKRVAGKVIVQGNVSLQLIYLPAGEDRPCQESFQIPFSQIMDAPEGEAGIAQAILYPTASYVEPIPGVNGSGAVSAEVHVTAQLVCTSVQAVRYIADIYCLHHPCQVRQEAVAVADPFRPVSLRETLRETFELPESAAEVLCSRAEAMLPLGSGEDGVKVPVLFRCIYRTEKDQLQSITKRMTANFRPEPGEMTRSVPGSPMCGELFVSASGTTLEVRAAVELPMITGEEQTIHYIQNAAAQTEEEIDLGGMPSLVAVRPDDRSCWTLAKTYYSTREMIEAVNPKGMEQNIILIPRAR